MQRILLIRLTALGDVVLTEPAIRALRRAFPGVAVDLVTEARYAPLMAEAAGCDRVIPYDRRGDDAGLAGVANVLERLGGASYDAVVDLQAKLRTRALAARVRAARRVTIRKRTLGKGVLALLGRDPPLRGIHSVDLYLGVFAALGVPEGALGPAPRPELHLAGAPRGHTRLRIGLAPGASHETKRWPPERFAALADRLQAAHPGAELVLAGGPDERAAIETIRAAAERASFAPADLTSLDVLGLARELARLDLFVGVDSGPAHIAAACGVPSVVLFGPTAPERWGPRGAPHRVVTLGLECAPCSNTGTAECPLPGRPHTCLRDLRVEAVLEAALDALPPAAAR